MNLDLYDGGRRAKQAGAVSAGNLTAEAAVVKLMCALGRGRTPSEAARLFRREWAGEGG